MEAVLATALLALLLGGCQSASDREAAPAAGATASASPASNGLPDTTLPYLSAQEFKATVLGNPGNYIIGVVSKACTQCGAVVDNLLAVNEAYGTDEPRVALLDADANPQIIRAFDITTVPTYMMFRDSQYVATYPGAATQADILNWFRSNY